jgi:hypothetical protein
MIQSPQILSLLGSEGEIDSKFWRVLWMDSYNEVGSKEIAAGVLRERNRLI